MTRQRVALTAVVGLALLTGIGAQTGALDRPLGAIVGSAAGIEVPPLDDPAMVRRGAAHYDRVCARCHASPDRPDRAAALRLSPPPPKLHLRVEAWTPEALFEIVRNGVPGTGMPAWPSAHRDDEVWSMVAFLRALPGMNPGTYRELAGLSRAAPELPMPLADCARCHGAEGRGTPDGAFPRLDIQTPEYLFNTLRAFRDGKRQSGFMQSVVNGLRDDELRTLAEHFGRASAATPPSQVPLEGDAPACTACHGPPVPARAEFPALAGQHESYLLTQLRLFRSGEAKRGGGPFAQLMERVAHAASEEELAARARWYASQ